jgi:hypothetical protein
MNGVVMVLSDAAESPWYNRLALSRLERADGMATIRRVKGSYRDFTFTSTDYTSKTTPGSSVVTYTANKETGLGFAHPPGPITEKEDEFFYIQKGDTVVINGVPDQADIDVNIVGVR